ncbi:MAG: T9SS type A sorting domain-containing protein [Paludibacteraceae bacterium]|nr:T9SS type A sorting domain-containing protein [Paludibacteraceae bacterium]
MKKYFLLLAILPFVMACAENIKITSGDVVMTFSAVDGGYQTNLSYKGTDIPFIEVGKPASLEVMKRTYSAVYSIVTPADSGYICVATVTSLRGSKFLVTDRYLNHGNGEIELRRDVKVESVVAGDNYFCSKFAIATLDNSTLTSNEYLVPGVMYKGYFDAACNTPEGLPRETDLWFIYRDDRTPLPFVMSRSKTSGITITLAHKDSKCKTVVNDANGGAYDAGYQFGACGMYRDTAQSITYQEVYYPGTTQSTRQGKGLRYHPVATDVKHAYNVYLKINTTDSYATAARESWNKVFDLYNPKIYPVDLDVCYEGLIESLKTYYVPSRADGGVYDKPGWPFEVSLSDFKPRGIDYQMGFVGMQVSAGYYIYRYGIEHNDKVTRHKGEAVLDFWADDCLGPAGMPSTWYDPRNDGGKGSWRNYESILRIMTGGMEGLLSAWCYGTKNGETHDNWISTCKKFGDWLVGEQDANGSLAFSWNRNKIQNGRHPVKDSNALTTPSALRYLVELYIATGDERYKEAALKAGEYCLLFVHKKYHYCAGVVDNPRVIDSESGYLAMQGFLSLYDLTLDQRWLTASEQAATYTETWVYSFEIPVEEDRAEDNPIFPRDRSIVGQHLIAIGHSAADLGFAWCSFAYYHLYLLTKNEHYLKMARMSAHNSKQSMNWDGTLYPGQPRGLQLEAFQVMIPRRVGGVATTLNWNYAGHLDPMFRFKDAFGTPNMEEVEKMSWEERIQKLARYMNYQSSDYGQVIVGVDDIKNEDVAVYPNPVNSNSSILVSLPGMKYTANIYSTGGTLVYSVEEDGETSIRMSYPAGLYTLVLRVGERVITKELIVI